MSGGRPVGVAARRPWPSVLGVTIVAVLLGACSSAPAAQVASTTAPTHQSADLTVAPRTDITPDYDLPSWAAALPDPGPVETSAPDPSATPSATGTETGAEDGTGDADEGYPARPTQAAPDEDDQFEQDVWAPGDDHRIPGTLSLPVSDGGLAPAVLLLHGDFGDRHASDFDELQEKLAASGVASLAIDFAGSGESEESQLELNYTSMLGDANAAFDYLLRDPEIDPRRVAVLGFSRGGSIAATMAGTRSDVAGLITWSGAVYNGEDELPDLHQEAREDGEAQVGDDLEIPLSWFDSIEASRPLDDVAGYTGPVLAVVGSADDVVDPSVATTFIDTVASSDKTLHVIDGADHGYSDDPAYGEDAVDTTTDWVVARLRS
ncbi:alpha/beta fold hydrolase [Nakamurella flava]|uniref:Alpha/beta fold hydrolase n=1 Tax=Nakamurella flava TaxID=2576308 RepID=A0A4V6CV77_9ACTN|nr:alpha/beta fold hydrolase [Nakamurella flava]